MTEEKKRQLGKIILVVTVMFAVGIFLQDVTREFLAEIRYYDTVMERIEAEEDEDFAKIEIIVRSENDEWFKWCLQSEDTTPGRVIKSVLWFLAEVGSILGWVLVLSPAIVGSLIIISTLSDLSGDIFDEFSNLREKAKQRRSKRKRLKEERYRIGSFEDRMEKIRRENQR